MTAVEDFETGLFLEGEEWLAYWSENMSYDEWENARTKAAEILAPKTKTKSLAAWLTERAKAS